MVRRTRRPPVVVADLLLPPVVVADILLLWQAEEAFVGFRRELSTLFKGVARVHASLAQVITEVITS